MKTLIEIVVLIIVLSIILFSFKLDAVFGQNFLDNLDNTFTKMIADCDTQFDTGIINTYTILCRSFMNDNDKVCQQQYHSYCFGPAWKDFDLTKHVSPP
jgi:hypothetical protein